MARWADNPTTEEASVLASTFQALLRSKPRDWSIVQGDGELVLRPPQRRLGKFSITVATPGPAVTLFVQFFSRRQGHWAGDRRLAASDMDAARSIMAWAEERTALELRP